MGRTRIAENVPAETAVMASFGECEYGFAGWGGTGWSQAIGDFDYIEIELGHGVCGVVCGEVFGALVVDGVGEGWFEGVFVLHLHVLLVVG